MLFLFLVVGTPILSNLSSKIEYKLNQKVSKYILVDDELFKRSQEGLLLKCVDDDEAKRIMHEVHEGIYGAHKSGSKIIWLIHKYGYYWPTIVVNYVAHVRRCEAY